MTNGNPRHPSNVASATKPPMLRLKLTLPVHDRHGQVVQAETQSNVEQTCPPHRHESTGSPERPSYSPVTPTESNASSTGPDDAQASSQTQWIEEPESLPIDMDENTDAIALKAAISALQIQRQRAQQEMRQLHKMKRAALDDPESFVEELQAGNLKRRAPVDLDSDSDESESHAGADQNSSKFGTLPDPQDIVRTPAVEWSKYHIVGTALDRLHEVQQHYPGFPEGNQTGPGRPRPQEVAAPYSPFTDQLDNDKQTSSTTTRN